MAGNPLPRHNQGKELAVYPWITDFAHVHINPAELSDMIETHGVGCELRRAVFCPCARVETRQSRTGCPHCHGLRFTYPEDLRDEVVALVQNRHPERSLVPSGEFVTGTAVLTFPIGIFPGLGDMVLPEGELHVVHETLWRGYQPIDNDLLRERTKRTIDGLAPKVEPGPDVLLYPRISCVEHLHWIDRDSGKLIRGALGTDYQLEGSRVVWTDGHGPTAGDAFSIRYRAQAAYILNPGEPVVRMESGQGMPYRVEGQRLDRWGIPSLRGED
jgi:hypothetical protein